MNGANGVASKKTGEAKVTYSPNIREQAIALAQQLIRIPSLTPIDPEARPAAAASLDCVQSYLETRGASCHRLTFEGGHAKWTYPVDNLYATWGNPGASAHLCFIGHTDVVPPGDNRLWSEDPYSGEIHDGFLHGRGATDMKGAVAAFCVAAAHCATSPLASAPIRISLILTTDEEWAAVNGVRRVLEWMRAQGEIPTMFIVGEPSSRERFGTHIKVGRRGSLCGRLVVRGVQGHVAYPGLHENPVRALNLALTILNAHRWNDALPGMPETNFEAVALVAGDPGVTAIVPACAEATWNIRFTHQQSVECLLANLQRLLSDPPNWARAHPDCNLLSGIEIIGNTHSVSLPYYSPPSQLAQLVAQVVALETGRCPVMDAAGGTTDGRFVHNYFPEAEILELGLPESGGVPINDEKSGLQGGMHQVGERCALSDLAVLTHCYAAILTLMR